MDRCSNVTFSGTAKSGVNDRMLLKSIKLGIGILAAMLICSQASAQLYGGYSNYGGGGGNCGRGITDSQAASLWDGYCTGSCSEYGGITDSHAASLWTEYCTESCGDFAGSSCADSSCGDEVSCDVIGCDVIGCDVAPICSQCKLFNGGRLRGLLGRGRCGCDQGGFGYPSDCCCCGDVFAEGYAGGYEALSYSASSCDTGIVSGGCGLFAGGGCRLRGRGTGLLARLFNRLGGGCLNRNLAPSYSMDYVSETFPACDFQCGSNCAYFDEFIGPEYGTTGMQSGVNGCVTGACGASSYDGGFDLGGSAEMSYGSGSAEMNYGVGAAETSYGGGAADMGSSGGQSQGAVDFGQQSDGAEADFGMGKSVVDRQVQSIAGEAVTGELQGPGN